MRIILILITTSLLLFVSACSNDNSTNAGNENKNRITDNDQTIDLAYGTQLQDKASELIKKWLDAQNSNNFKSYETLYSKSFNGIKMVGDNSHKFDYDGWLKDRNKMFKDSVVVKIEEPHYEFKNNEIVVTFIQVWESGAYKDKGEKLIELTAENGELKIIHEEMKSSFVIKQQEVYVAAPGFSKVYSKANKEGVQLGQVSYLQKVEAGEMLVVGNKVWREVMFYTNGVKLKGWLPAEILSESKNSAQNNVIKNDLVGYLIGNLKSYVEQNWLIADAIKYAIMKGTDEKQYFTAEYKLEPDEDGGFGLRDCSLYSKNLLYPYVYFDTDTAQDIANDAFSNDIDCTHESMKMGMAEILSTRSISLLGSELVSADRTLGFGKVDGKALETLFRNIYVTPDETVYGLKMSTLYRNYRNHIARVLEVASVIENLVFLDEYQNWIAETAKQLESENPGYYEFDLDYETFLKFKREKELDENTSDNMSEAAGGESEEEYLDEEPEYKKLDYADWNFIASFIMRRKIDGSYDSIKLIAKKILTDYDPQLLAKYSELFE